MQAKRTTLVLVLLAAAPLVWGQLLGRGFGVADDLLKRGVGDTLNELERETDKTVEKTTETASETEQKIAERTAATAKQVREQVATVVAETGVLNLTGNLLFSQVTLDDGFDAVKDEWLTLVSKDELAQIGGLNVVEQRYLKELDRYLVRFVIAEGSDYATVLGGLPDPIVARTGRNHIYQLQRDDDYQTAGAQSAAFEDQRVSLCKRKMRLGVIDTAVNLDHSAFAKSRISQQTFLPADLAEASDHGSAIVGTLVGAEEHLVPLVPKAQVFNASVFYRSEERQGARLDDLVAGLDWLVSQDVQVINMSLAGPANPVLQAVLARAFERDIVVVAAVGNSGPSAPVLYPAGYPEVVGVTAVDYNKRIFRFSNRGEQVDFSAPGVAVITVKASGGLGLETGTSLAVPVITATFGCGLAKRKSPDKVLAMLEKEAEDLGEQGRDPVFGYGLITRTIRKRL